MAPDRTAGPRLQKEVGLKSEPLHVTRPISFLNPTSAYYELEKPASSKSDGSSKPSDGQVGFKWSSRNNRKGRHALTVDKETKSRLESGEAGVEIASENVWQGVRRMLIYYPIWNVSFDVAYIFTWGSIVWVINAMFDLLPITNPSSEFPGESLYGGGITAFVGATIFELGSVFLMIEALNENRAGCFGWAIEHAMHTHSDSDTEHTSSIHIAPKQTCRHHHGNKGNLVGKPRTNEANFDSHVDTTPPGARNWIWWPSWKEFTSHYLREIGFLACSAQMFGATIFWIAGFTALPGIYNNLTPRLVNGVYWIPQIIGGSGFVVSGTLFMIESQQRWWKPAPNVLGWWIGGWNLIGGIGFTLCPIFGLMSPIWAQNQASVSTFWGSWAFLIGSVIQWYESLSTHPVETHS